MDLKLRCSAGSGCDCVNFVAATSKDSLRVCDGCSHSWMTHLLEKLMTSRDDALSIFDVCSLALYGTHALPIRLKIVIERLLATLQPDEVDKILRSFGWTPQDLARGYMVQDPRGGLLSKWTMPPRDEEVVILQQFFRFPITSALSFALMRDDFPLMSPGMGAGVLRPSNFSSLFHPLLNHTLAPTTNNPATPSLTNNNNNTSSANNNGNNLSSTNSTGSACSSSNTSLLSPKSPLNHNNNNNVGGGVGNVPSAGSLFALNSHLNHLGGLGLPHFPPVSLANFTSNVPTPSNNHSNSNHPSSGQNNGKSHHHQQNNEQRGVGAGGSGDRSRGRNSRRSTNSSALNLSVQSDSDEEDNHNLSELNLSSAAAAAGATNSSDQRKQANEVVDLSSSTNTINGNLSSKSNSKRMSSSSASGGGGGNGSSSSMNHTPTSSSNNDHHPLHHLHAAERDRLISSLNSLIPNATNHMNHHHGGHHPLNHHLNHLHQQQQQQQHGLVKGGESSVENHHHHQSSSLSREKDQSNHRSSGNPLGMSNELLNNLNNMHNLNKSVDLMAAAAAMANSSNGPSGGGGGGGHGTPHSRKAMQPLKRERGWNPVPMSAGQLVNPSSAMTAAGKRRVQCSVCLKTFCDKGALKIHFSAVHLREMHKCTVAGCNMMFSSRRSRNRHSANPNPKLHSPHLRRKISPHDGRSSQPLINLNNPMLFPGSGMRFPPFLPGMGLPHNGRGGAGMSLDDKDDDKSSDDDTMDLKHMVKMERGMMMDPDGSNSEASFSSNEANEELLEPKSSPSNNSSSNKKDGARKRKLTNPVRLSNVADESNDEFCCYDDGTVVSHEDDDIEDNDEPDQRYHHLSSTKSEDGSSVKHGESNSTSPQNGHPGTPPDGTKHNTDGEYDDRDGKRRKSSDGELLDSTKVNKLKTFPNKDVISRRLSSADDNHNNSEKSMNHNDDGNNEEETDHLGKLEALPIFSSTSPHNNLSDSSLKSEDEDNREETGSPNSNGDIPLDPDNPRQCLVCGKHFPNPFGVKVHMQNVHLKLMHKCTVDGCKAAFPSKRSRDRHASNLNLHRKLLSTSDTSNHGCSSNDSFNKDNVDDNDDEEERETPSLLDTSPIPPSLLAPHHAPLSATTTTPNAFFNPYNLFNNNGFAVPPNVLGLPSQSLSPPMGNTPWNPFLHSFNMFPSAFGAPHLTSGVPKDVPSIIVDCRFCGKSFVEGPTFINHLESSHSEDLFRCKCCSLVFDSGKKLESHSKTCVD